MFIIYQEYRRRISVANRDIIFTKGFSDILIRLDIYSIQLKNIWYTLDLLSNLISVTDLSEQGFTVKIDTESASISRYKTDTDTDTVIATISVSSKQY